MWTNDFLVGRQQRVRVGSKFYGWKNVHSKEPQGTFLGPLLFLLYVDDLPSLLSSSILLYANDVKIRKVIKNKCDTLELQHDLKKSSECSRIWQLPINASKCIMMHIDHLYTDTYMVNNIERPVDQTHDNLKVIVC